MKLFAFVRRRADTEPAAPWIDTVPACFRSEAFAEDLQPPEGSDADALSGVRPAQARARWRPPRSAWTAALARLGRRSAATP